MTRWKCILVALAVVSLIAPLAAHAAAISLYDDFSGDKIDAAKWQQLEFVREIRGGKLVSSLRAAGVPGSVSNTSGLPSAASIQSLGADVRLLAYTLPPGGHALMRVAGYFYNDGSAGTGNTVDVAVNLVLRGTSAGVNITYDGFRCTNPDCSTSTTVFPVTTVKSAALGEMHTLAIGWNGAVFTFTVDGVPTVVDPRPIVPIGSPNPKVEEKKIGARLWFAGPGGEGSVVGDYDNVYVNGTLYDNFDGVAPNSGPRLNPAKWANLDEVREVAGGRLVSKVAFTGAQYAARSSSTRFVNEKAVSAMRADITVTEYQSIDGSAQARLKGVYYNDGSSTGPADQTGDVSATFHIRSDTGGPLTAVLKVWRCDDAACSTDHFLPGSSDAFGVVNIGETHTVSLAWNGSVFEYGMDGVVRTYDPRPYAPVVKPPATTSRDLRTTASSWIVGAYAYMAATFDNVYVTLHTDAVGVFRPSNGTFYLDSNASGQWDGCGTDKCLQIGMVGDVALVGDWNGSGTAKVGVFRPSDGTFYLDYNGNGQWDGCGTDRCLSIGMNGDIPLVGDWNGSGTSKVGAFRPTDGTFYLDYNGSGTWDGCGVDRCLQIGMLGDIPLVGDWNGSGTSKVAVFRPSDGTFYLDYNGSGTWEGCGTDRCLSIGMNGDIPLVGDWNGTGSAKVGAFRPSDGTFYLDYDGSGTWNGCGTDRCLQIGMSGDAPLVGKW